MSEGASVQEVMGATQLTGSILDALLPGDKWGVKRKRW